MFNALLYYILSLSFRDTCVYHGDFNIDTFDDNNYCVHVSNLPNTIEFKNVQSIVNKELR